MLKGGGGEGRLGEDNGREEETEDICNTFNKKELKKKKKRKKRRGHWA